jgi:uncharacterized protein YprB with RNaseH-like and TPR domain
MRLLNKHNIEDILFFDIETAHGDYGFNEESQMYDAWKYDHMKEVETVEELIALYMQTAPLYGEYGRVACITIGAVRDDKVILKTFKDADEKVLLEQFMESVTKFANNKTVLCGHNILDFDIPFVAKRAIVNRVPLHLLFDTAHLKPWETSVLDTAVLWKGTGWKKQSFLSVLSALGLPSPKDDISGKDVGRVYWTEGVDRVATYCEKDVLQTVNLFRALRYEEPLEVAETFEPKKEGIIDYLYNGGAYTEEIEMTLKEFMETCTDKEKKMALEILYAIPTKAKGKETFITKKDIKKLCSQ